MQGVALGRVYMLGTAFVFAAAFVATKYTVDTVTPALAAALRFVFAAAALYGWLGWGPGKSARTSVAPRDWFGLILLGASGIFAYHALFFWALQYTTASLAAIIVPTTIPVATVILSGIVNKEKLGRRGWGIALAAAGAVLALWRPEEAALGEMVLRGELALLAAVLCFALYTVGGQRLVAKYGALQTTAHATAAGAAMLLLVSWGQWGALPHITAGAWGALLFMGWVSSAAGLVWYYKGGELLGPGRAASFLYFVPLFTVLLAVVLLKETVYAVQLLGGVVIIVGVAIVQQKQRSIR